MSHFKSYQCQVDNEVYLTKALEEMGYSVQKNAVITDWAHQNQTVDLGVVKDGKLLPLGFKAKENGKGYEIVADWFMIPEPEKEFTNKVAQLHDKYRVFDMCEMYGWNIDYESITTNKEGEIELLATQWA